MEIIQITAENLDREHICCAITEKKGESCVFSKKAWMKACLMDGLVFKKLNVRGKVFIEYIPAENAWCPVDANNYMFIDCFWVSGQYKGQGYANKLLDETISDAKMQGKSGLAAVSSHKKMPFLSDPKFFKYRGFKVADTTLPYFELLYLPFEAGTEIPHFRDSVKPIKIAEKGIVIYFSDHCPWNAKYIPLLLDIAKERGVPVTVHKIETKEQAQNAPTPFTTYSLFFNGNFLTNEMFGDKKVNKFLDEQGL